MGIKWDSDLKICSPENSFDRMSQTIDNRDQNYEDFEEISMPDRLLGLALADLEASRLLYEHGHYPQSVFFLQQSVEKACKSPGIFFELITEKESLGKIGHKPLKIIEKTTDEFAGSVRDTCQKLADNPSLIPVLKTMDLDYVNAIQQIDIQIKNVYTYLESLNEYDLTIAQINEILSELKKQTLEAENSLTRLTTIGITDEEYSDIKTGFTN